MHLAFWSWIQAYAPELNKRCRPHLKPTNKELSHRRDLYFTPQHIMWRGGENPGSGKPTAPAKGGRRTVARSGSYTRNALPKEVDNVGSHWFAPCCHRKRDPNLAKELGPDASLPCYGGQCRLSARPQRTGRRFLARSPGSRCCVRLCCPLQDMSTMRNRVRRPSGLHRRHGGSRPPVAQSGAR